MNSVTGETPLARAGAAERAFYKVTIAAPIETVWNILVKTDEVLPFFFGAICRTPGSLEPGAPIAMETRDGKFRSVVGEVLEFSPPHRYAHTFKFTNMKDAPCTVIYELEEVAGGTEFTLITENVPVGTNTEKSMAQGGSFITQNLKSLVETGRPTMSGKMVMMLGPVLGWFTPRVCRSENWSFDRIRKL
jgi:uncharacterized protein YndB with AHSA1/START domain